MKRSPSIPHYVFEQCWGACAGEVLAFAGTLGAGGLRSGIARDAGILLEKSFGAAEEPAQVTSIAS